MDDWGKPGSAAAAREYRCDGREHYVELVDVGGHCNHELSRSVFYHSVNGILFITTLPIARATPTRGSGSPSSAMPTQLIRSLAPRPRIGSAGR